jgi:glycosyltransferase involved in cell wall biosynthesis
MNPTFSIVIFTKNRSQLARLTLESVLRQSFRDLEVILCDNDDTDSTRDAVAYCRDSRFRYHRTGGKLSMADNWETGLSMAAGRYVLSLSDRMVLKQHALTRIWREIQEHGLDVYVWQYDVLLQRRRGDTVLRYSAPRGTEEVPSDSLINQFLRSLNGYAAYSHRLPRGLNSCCSRAVLEEIRATTGGRVCFPAERSPDFTQAFLTLVHRSSVVMINEPLFVWGSLALSNGGGGYDGTDTFRRYLSDLGLTEDDLYDRVPIKTIGIHTVLCNDLMHLKAALPERFANIELDVAAYFIACHDEIVRWLSVRDPLYASKIGAWRDALAGQPSWLRDEVEQKIAEAEKKRPAGGESGTEQFRRMEADYSPSLGDLPWFSKDGIRNRLGRTARCLYNAVFPRRRPRSLYKFRTALEAADWLERLEEWERQSVVAAKPRKGSRPRRG